MNENSDNLILVPNESWRDILAMFQPRLDALKFPLPETLRILEETMPDWVVEGESNQTFAAFSIQWYARGQFSISLQVTGQVISLWESGGFVIVPLNTRYVFEIWGAIHFACNLHDAFLRGNNLELLDEKLKRLTLGSHSEVHLPWGGMSELKSHNVMDFVRSLIDKEANAVEMYRFLSEASHPNFVQNTYFKMAGPPISNWSNKRFKDIVLPMLDHTLVILEKAVLGMQYDLQKLLPSTLELIRRERGHKEQP
jgi:hypothetical protein